MALERPVTAFISYSQSDEGLKDLLLAHLAALRRDGLLAVWHDRRIAPGDDWKDRIDQHLESAQMVLLLVSPSFIASDYCYDIEMTRALERRRSDGVTVVPILLRPVDWTSSPFAGLQALPRNGKAVTEWPDQDAAFRDIATALRELIEHGSADATAAAVTRASLAGARSRSVPWLVVSVIAAVLTLATRVFFQIQLPEAPLDAGSTIVVLLFWLTVVLVVRYAAARVGALLMALGALAIAPAHAFAEVACAPSAATPAPGTTVTVTAFVDGTPAGVLRFESLDGTVTQRDATSAGWTVPTELGTYSLRVTTDGKEACVARVMVRPPGHTRGWGTEPGKALLLGNTPEGEGYGLYTYLLFAGPPVQATRERYLAALTGYTSAFIALSDLEATFSDEKRSLNAFYLPVAKQPADDSIAALLDAYDFARARRLLSTIDPSLRSGPYLISSTRPLSVSAAVSPLIQQDLSPVPPSLVPAWIQAFASQVAQQVLERRVFQASLVLRVRTVLSVIAGSTPAVATSLSELVKTR